jgi:hypothetical protein
MIWPIAGDARPPNRVKKAATPDMTCFSPFLRMELDTLVSLMTPVYDRNILAEMLDF